MAQVRCNCGAIIHLQDFEAGTEIRCRLCGAGVLRPLEAAPGVPAPPSEMRSVQARFYAVVALTAVHAAVGVVGLIVLVVGGLYSASRIRGSFVFGAVALLFTVLALALLSRARWAWWAGMILYGVLSVLWLTLSIGIGVSGNNFGCGLGVSAVGLVLYVVPFVLLLPIRRCLRDR